MNTDNITDEAGAEVKVKKIRKYDTLKLTFLIPVIVLTTLVIVAIFAPYIAPYEPTVGVLKDRLLPPAFVSVRRSPAPGGLRVPRRDRHGVTTG